MMVRRPSFAKLTKDDYASEGGLTVVPLATLDVNSVCKLLDSMSLSAYTSAFRSARITGEMLQEFESAEDLVEEGIDFASQAEVDRFLAAVAGYKTTGVAASMLGR